MRSLVLALSAFAVVGLGFWAYRENYRTQSELAEVGRLGLLPLEPRQFGTVAAVSYPAIALPPITEPVDTIASAGVPNGTAQ